MGEIKRKIEERSSRSRALAIVRSKSGKINWKLSHSANATRLFFPLSSVYPSRKRHCLNRFVSMEKFFLLHMIIGGETAEVSCSCAATKKAVFHVASASCFIIKFAVYSGIVAKSVVYTTINWKMGRERERKREKTLSFLWKLVDSFVSVCLPDGRVLIVARKTWVERWNWVFAFFTAFSP